MVCLARVDQRGLRPGNRSPPLQGEGGVQPDLAPRALPGLLDWALSGSVPEGRMTIAQQFTAGNQGNRENRGSPVGSTEVATDPRARSSLRDLERAHAVPHPSDESLGYCQTPLPGLDRADRSGLVCNNEGIAPGYRSVPRQGSRSGTELGFGLPLRNKAFLRLQAAGPPTFLRRKPCGVFRLDGLGTKPRKADGADDGPAPAVLLTFQFDEPLVDGGQGPRERSGRPRRSPWPRC
jgi:hypothetical protein